MRFVNVFLWFVLFSCMTVFGVVLLGVGAGTALAGSLDPPAAPTSTGSAMYTLADIYNRLNAGTAGAKRTGAFTEPSSGPAAGGFTLDDVMGKAPYVDNATGAGVADVTSGKKFWGLTSGAWGIATGTGSGGGASGNAVAADVLSGKTFSNSSATGLTGTMTNNGAGGTITPGTSNKTVAAGYWSSANTVSGDSDLTAGNIKNNVQIFGVTGTYGGGGSSSAGVPRTWQRKSYLAGDDGALQKGVPWPSPRFTDNGNGTVKDNLTGLIWLKNANCYGKRAWANAVTSCRNLANGACGLSDGSTAGSWRLANIKELMSLLDFGQYSLIPAGAPFTSRQVLNYWASTTYPKDTGSAYAMGFNKGQVGFMGKGNANYVWPVRGGQ